MLGPPTSVYLPTRYLAPLLPPHGSSPAHLGHRRGLPVPRETALSGSPTLHSIPEELPYSFAAPSHQLPESCSAAYPRARAPRATLQPCLSPGHHATLRATLHAHTPDLPSYPTPSPGQRLPCGPASAQAPCTPMPSLAELPYSTPPRSLPCTPTRRGPSHRWFQAVPGPRAPPTRTPAMSTSADLPYTHPPAATRDRG